MVFVLGKYFLYHNGMDKIELPITGEALAYATKAYVDQVYGQVRESLERTHLPRALLAIWASSPMLNAERKERPEPTNEIREICHVLVTFPGSTAIERITGILINSGLVPYSEGQYKRAHKIASELFTLTMPYTKVQNLSRHIRTSVNSHLRMLNIEPSRDRTNGNYPSENHFTPVQQNARSEERIFTLRSAKLFTEIDVNDWAEEVNRLLADYSIKVSDRAKDSPTAARLSSSGRPRGAVAPGAINSYKLRFKQALSTALGIDLSGRNVSTTKASSRSIENLLRELDDMPANSIDLYERLQSLHPQRVNPASRYSVLPPDLPFSGNVQAMSRFDPSMSKHVLNLGGRELVIEGSGGAFTNEMILGILKTVSLQLSIDPDASELRVTFESRGQILHVQIEQPKKSDHRKLSEILAQLN
jgi:hypothetical protein